MAKRQFHLNDKEINELKRYEQQSKRPAELLIREQLSKGNVVKWRDEWEKERATRKLA